MEFFSFLAVMLLTGVACAGSVVLTQTHPAAPYVCRTGNITLRCQYDGVVGVAAVLWVIGTEAGTLNPSTIPGHTALPRTTTYQEVVVDSYTNLAAGYRCVPILSDGSLLQSNTYIPQLESAEVTVSSLTLASRTATTLSVIWSAGYPECYSFTVSHSTQDGSIAVTQPANSDTSHTLTSLQPGTTYRIEVEAVRKGDGADGQRAKVMGNFTTEDEGVQCPPRCTHKYCSKRARNSKVCSLPGLGSCTGACKVTSCGACYYNDAPREIPSGCQQRCNGLTGQPLQRCLNRWGVCIRKRYKMLYSKDQTKRKRLFKCFEHPC